MTQNIAGEIRELDISLIDEYPNHGYYMGEL